ncbi:MAG: hypothetical protein WBV74_03485 [Pseudonocardiaceae bacterium]
MTERFDAHNISIDEQLAREGACAQIHLPSGRTCGLPLHHHGSCRFLHAADSPAPARRRHLARRAAARGAEFPPAAGGPTPPQTAGGQHEGRVL